MKRLSLILFAGLILQSCAVKPPMKPMINDITTDPYNPPQYRALAKLPANKGRDMRYPKKNIAVQEKEYPDVAPLRSKFAPDQTFKCLKELGLSMSRWELIAEDPANYTLEFVATTLLMRYKDDIIIQVTPEQTGSTVHMRSKSRAGLGDLGANADRIRGFFQKFREIKS